MITRTRMGVYVVDADTSFSRIVEHFCTLETPETLHDVAFVAPLIPEGGVVIDAGACLGDHTALYSQIVGASGHVYAYEPHPIAYQALTKNMARLTNVSCAPVGLSDVSETALLHMTPNLGASFVGDCTDEGFPEEVIRLVSLDRELLPRLTRCDFIHLDAEGMEYRILLGAKALVERFRPAMLLEVTDTWLRRCGTTPKDLQDLLKAWDYQFQVMQSNPMQFDVVCVPNPRQTVDRVPVLSDTQAVS